MTKLVLYTENYFPGGLERFIFDLLKSDMFEIHVIVNSENSRIIKFVQDNEINYTVIHLFGIRINTRKNSFYNKFVKMLNFFIYYISMFINYFKIKSILKKLSDYTNIIIVNGGYPAALSSLSATVAAKRVGYKNVGLSILSSPSPNYRYKAFCLFQLKIDSYIDKYVDFYIPNSSKIKSELISLLGIEPHKINVVYTGVDFEEKIEKIETLKYSNGSIEKNKTDVWIAMLGLLGSTKRQDIAIKAMAKLDKNFKLILAGDGPDRNKLEKLVSSLNLENRVIFLGWIENTKDVYLFSDLVVFVSNQEGLPYVVSEAMSYRIPIIASAVGGIPEQVIDEKGGLLLNNNNEVELAEKINALYTKKDSIQRYTEYSFTRLKEMFSVDAMYNKILKLYQ